MSIQFKHSPRAFDYSVIIRSENTDEHSICMTGYFRCFHVGSFLLAAGES
jgi:hypothetical protein